MASTPPTSSPVVPCASGVAALDLRWAMGHLFGAEVVREAMERLSPEARDEWRAATALSWIRYDTLTELHNMVARIANKDPEEIVVPLARATVTRSFTTVWRILLRITSDAAIVQRTPAFYTRSRNVGKMSAQILSAGIAESIVSEFPGMPLRDIVALAASIETVLTLAGRVDVKSRGTRTPDGARFLTRWRVK